MDAVVIGSGPNGLVAANVLADAGWDVVVLEAQPEPGGAVRTAELTRPGFHHDLCSAFYPLAAVSPVLLGLHLEDHGLVWRRPPAALAHPTPDGRCAVIGSDLDITARSLDDYRPGDGDGWRTLMSEWDRVGGDVVAALLGPWPPVRAGVRLAVGQRVSGLTDLARLGLVPARRLGAEHFAGEGGRLLLAGCAMHTDLAPESAGSGFFGWLLCALAQTVGFPVPEGGAGALTAALLRRLEAAGGQVRCGQPVEQVLVEGGRATGVRTAAGEEVRARRAVLADVAAPHLYERLLAGVPLPGAVSRTVRRFEWDQGTVKVDWALSAPVPWSAPAARTAGTVHLGDDMAELTRASADLAAGTDPTRPFVLVGQQSMTDPTRMPEGAETLWAYTHTVSTPPGTTDAVATAVDRMEERIEAAAPGFRRLVLGRHVMGPANLEARDANLAGGAVNGGTAQLHQQLVLRPGPGSGRPTTFLDGLYLASSSAHPGGGVHGACGANAARSALTHARWDRVRRRTWRQA